MEIKKISTFDLDHLMKESGIPAITDDNLKEKLVKFLTHAKILDQFKFEALPISFVVSGNFHNGIYNFKIAKSMDGGLAGEIVCTLTISSCPLNYTMSCYLSFFGFGVENVEMPINNKTKIGISISWIADI